MQEIFSVDIYNNKEPDNFRNLVLKPGPKTTLNLDQNYSKRLRKPNEMK